jgi:hypothetical protein
MKYVAIHRPRSDWFEEERPMTVQTSMTVYQREDGPEDTGLLDSNGVKLYRVSDKTKVGYI